MESVVDPDGTQFAQP